MILEKRINLKQTVPFLLIGLLIFILYLFLFVDIEAIAGLIYRTDLFYFSLGVFALFLDVFFYSLAWQFLLSPLSVKTSFRKTFLFVWVGTFVDLMVPAESVTGEITKVYLMSKNSNGNTGKIVASIVSHRILSMSLTLFSLFAGSALYMLKYDTLPAYTLKLITIIALGTIIIFFWSFFSGTNVLPKTSIFPSKILTLEGPFTKRVCSFCTSCIIYFSNHPL